MDLDVPLGYGMRWIQEKAANAALNQIPASIDGDAWFDAWDLPDVEEVGEEPVDVFLWRVGATPLPGFQEVS